MNDFFIMIEKLSGLKAKKGIQKIKNPFPLQRTNHEKDLKRA